MKRRQFIAGASGLVLSGAASRLLAAPAQPSTQCFTTRQVTPGPFILPTSPLRSDIREGLPGVPITLNIRIIDDLWCQPASDVTVDVWQCDAIGRYSGAQNLTFDPDSLQVVGVGLDLRDQQFLRGHQVSDSNGMVSFTTVFPGWYVPRLPHIHVTATWKNVPWTRLSTQLFFPEDIQRAVFESPSYVDRGPSPIDASRDIVIKGEQSRLDALTVDMAKDGEGFVANFEIATAALGDLEL
jgi:protocatechuate 3,4-dioxygenase beta subunit